MYTASNYLRHIYLFEIFIKRLGNRRAVVIWNLIKDWQFLKINNYTCNHCILEDNWKRKI